MEAALAVPRSPSVVSRLGTGAVVGLLLGLLVKDLGLRQFVSFWGAMSPVVLGATVVGALAWLTRLRLPLGVVTALLAILWLVVAFTPLTTHLVAPLVRTDALKKADAIFVLSSNVQIDDEPSPSALSRATRGLELFGSGWAPRLLLSELPAPAGSYKGYVQDSARKLGIASTKGIEDVGFVGNTHDEAKLVAALFKAKGWKTLLLVTSPTHSRRAASTFEKAGIPEVVSVPAVETLFDSQRLASSDERIVAFSSAAHEWLGLFAYRMRGW